MRGKMLQILSERDFGEFFWIYIIFTGLYILIVIFIGGWLLILDNGLRLREVFMK